MRYFLIFIGLFLLNSCSYETSKSTDWDYNNPMNGGFEKKKYYEQETGPGLILIEGGTFNTLLNMDDTTRHEVLVPSYYMDMTEVTNLDWREYLYWTQRTFSPDFTQIYYNALPDTNQWREVAGYSHPMELNYLRHPSYGNYPVVGVSWMQANNYCAWRTDRVNENILIREGVLLVNPMQQNEPFTTDAYLVGQYESGSNPRGQLTDLDPANGGFNPATGKITSYSSPTRNVKKEDGILLPRYRLPTEIEWEYAASVNSEENIFSKKEMKLRQSHLDLMGDFVKDKKGDYYNGHMIAGVNAYLPNDYGLFNMSGNVSEWVLDVYKEEKDLSIKMAPFVGEELKVPVRQADHYVENKNYEVLFDVVGMKSYLKDFREVRNLTHPIDSIENELLLIIEDYVNIANESYDKKLYAETSQYIRTIFDRVFTSYNSLIQNEVGPAGYDIEIIPILRFGLSQFIVDLPGNIRMRDLTPVDNLTFQNNIKRFDQYEEKVLAFKNDSLLQSNHFRVYKGASWVDEANWMNPYARRSLNKYESSATIGFRCAMDRLGSPKGIGKKKSKSKSKTEF